MRVGIVGGGGAGVITAWLLAETHEVTLFEKADYLGGHAHTLHVETDGGACDVNTGFHFFCRSTHPTFTRVLADRVPLDEYKMSGVLWDTQNKCGVALPPFGSMARLTSKITVQSLSHLVRLRRVLRASEPLFRENDTSITLGDFVASQALPERFIERFLYPFLASNWGVSNREIQTYAAADVLYYAYVQSRNIFRRERWIDVRGGMQAYVTRLCEDCTDVEFRTNAEVSGVRRTNGEFEISKASGETYRCHHLVLATDARTARRLLSGDASEQLLGALGAFDYYKTRIAVHGDTRLMPPNRRLWSVVNMMYDAQDCRITHWAGWRENVDVFRSWLAKNSPAPEPLYGEFVYDHPKPTPAYFAAQKEIARLQGMDNIWLAGMYCTGMDNHEGAGQSAIAVARQLAPGSQRLTMIDRDEDLNRT